MWPTDMSEIPDTPEALGYVLLPTLTSLWPRRYQEGPNRLFQADETLSYDVDTDRPGMGLELPSKFLNPVDGSPTAHGKPVWAWGFSPSAGPTNGIRAGWLGIDPAYFIWRRHHSSVNDNALVTYDDTTGEGFSLTYCFNGFANIDVRTTDPKCQ